MSEQKKLPEIELTGEAIKAAEYYMKSLGVKLPIKEGNDLFNAIARGFFMGVRWKEERDELQKHI